MNANWLDVYRYVVQAADQEDELSKAFQTQFKDLATKVYSRILSERINKMGTGDLVIDLPSVSRFEYETPDSRWHFTSEGFVINPTYLYDQLALSVGWFNELSVSPVIIEYSPEKIAKGLIPARLIVRLS